MINLHKGGPFILEFNFDSFSIMLPSLPVTLFAIILIALLVKWSKQLKTRRFTIFFYFLIGSYITPILTLDTQTGFFQLWIPLGFLILLFYLFHRDRYHPAKMKASILGLCLAIYQIILQYMN